MDKKRSIIQCNRCGDKIESKHRYDFKWCSCKSVYLDGGPECQRIGYTKKSDYTILYSPHNNGDRK